MPSILLNDTNKRGGSFSYEIELEHDDEVEE